MIFDIFEETTTGNNLDDLISFEERDDERLKMFILGEEDEKLHVAFTQIGYRPSALDQDMIHYFIHSNDIVRLVLADFGRLEMAPGGGVNLVSSDQKFRFPSTATRLPYRIVRENMLEQYNDCAEAVLSARNASRYSFSLNPLDSKRYYDLKTGATLKSVALLDKVKELFSEDAIPTIIVEQTLFDRVLSKIAAPVAYVRDMVFGSYMSGLIDSPVWANYVRRANEGAREFAKMSSVADGAISIAGRAAINYLAVLVAANITRDASYEVSTIVPSGVFNMGLADVMISIGTGMWNYFKNGAFVPVGFLGKYRKEKRMLI